MSLLVYQWGNQQWRSMHGMFNVAIIYQVVYIQYLTNDFGWIINDGGVAP
ncbi:hypothetical protein [Marinicellulosiphila megalodicopiae]